MPIRVRSVATGEELELDSASAKQAILRGDVSPVEGTVTMRSGADTGVVRSEDLAQAFAAGGELVDEEERAALGQKREASSVGGQALGALERAGAGASLGLTDYLLSKSGGRAEVSARKEALGGLGTAAEVAGALVPAVLSGGGSLAGRAALATPAGALELGSAAVGRLASRALPNSVARVAVPTARGMVEGAVAGAGQEISEASLGDREITADNVLAAGGMGALLGGAVGLSIPGVTAAARTTGRVSSKAMQTILRRGSGDAVQSVAEAGAPGIVAKAYAATTGGDPAKLQRIVDRLGTPEGQGNLAMGKHQHAEATSKLARELGTNIDEMNDAVGLGLQHTEGRGKFMEGVGLPRNADFVAPRAASKALQEAGGKLDGFKSDVEKFGADFIGTSTRDVETILATTEQKLLNSKTARETMRAMDEGQTQLRQLTQKLRQERGGDPRLQATAKRIDDIRISMRNHTYDERIYGRAAQLSKEGDALQAAAIQARTAVPGKRSAAQRVLARDEPTTMDDLMSVSRKFGRSGPGSMEESIDQVFRKEIDYMEWLAKNREMPPEFHRALEASKEKFAKLEGAVAANRTRIDDLDLMNYARGLESGDSVSIGITSNLGTTVGGGLGYALGGPVGGVIGAALGRALASPATTARTLAGLLDTASKAGIRVDRQVGKFLARTDKTTDAIAPRTGRKALPAKASARTATAVGTQKALEDRRSKQRSVRQRVAYLASNPTALADELTHALAELDDAAPGLSGVMRERMQLAATYLDKHKPMVFTPPYGGEPMVDPIVFAAYQRRIDAIEDPIETLGLMESGRLTFEHVEAIRTVYPKLYAGVRDKVFERLAEKSAKGEHVAFGVRMQAAILFQQPTDPTLEPAVLAQLQPPAPMPSNEQGPPNTQSQTANAGGATPDVAQRYDTTTTRMERGASS